MANTNIPRAVTFKAWDAGKPPRVFAPQLGAWKGPLALIVYPCHRPLNVRLRSVSGDRAEANANEPALLMELIRR